MAIARRIELLDAKRRAAGVPARILILKGDVKGVFRHLRVAADHVQWIGGTVDCRFIIFDLSAPFGWRGSPAYYSVFVGE